MKARITAFTMEYDNIKESQRLSDIINSSTLSESQKERDINDFIKQSFEIFSGKNAGICYMGGNYDKLDSESDKKTIKRFENTIGNTHHSISDHCNITVVFEHVPKFLAMILNSLQVYATSEKSARYTVMKNLSRREQELYDKWTVKIKDLLISQYEVDEKDAIKLAQENARYFISIFSPATTFAYTTSLRQWNYIHNWFDNYIKAVENIKYGNNKKLCIKTAEMFKEFNEWFETSAIYNPIIKEPKNRIIDFIAPLYPNIESPVYLNRQHYGDSYAISYMVSMTALAQLQRHRSIKYSINLFRLYSSGEPVVFYVPKMFIDNLNLIAEWNNDMHSVKDLFPQGMMVEVEEQGTIDKFLLKCDERLCGRVQYETAQCCKRELMLFVKNRENLSPYFADKVNAWVDEKDDENEFFMKRIKAKCEMRGGCADDGCMHGPLGALDRRF